jgi:hypothetical protein
MQCFGFLHQYKRDGWLVKLAVSRHVQIIIRSTSDICQYIFQVSALWYDYLEAFIGEAKDTLAGSLIHCTSCSLSIFSIGRVISNLPFHRSPAEIV